MRNEVYTDYLGKPLNNHVLVEVEDIFDKIITKSGIELPNMSHEESKGDSPNYSFREFAVRFGRVVNVPETISVGSFDYETECEVEKGDIVYWNYFSFLNHQPVVMGDRKFLLVDYHEILLKIRDDKLIPINGNALFTPVQEIFKFGEYESVVKKTNRWKIFALSEKEVKHLNPRHYTDTEWKIGDEVILAVGDMAFEIEGDIVRNLDEKLYAAPVRMILCTSNLSENI